ncbi:MAG: hypothetical protein UU23_C0004G0038 [Candidatus Curtissbacteria bacterium GW2011_GWA1_40_9]|uniref:DUF4258 domain-containing protein n=1 Tax=Candidatus Curtissbacteria bacterium GW2011_GWA1_40_9 TaxID=1618408 RepID=A0A0G0TT72_9BACT|nr:MAG: hypothetical protein UU23_C0004G0038 [Candidatus Curtissbacteria bacterium GW2011_GWA1_40_9]
MKIVYTKHAKEMLLFRKITKHQVENTIKNPENKSSGRKGKSILFKDFGNNLLKVVISQENSTIFVITEHWIAKKRVKK